MHTETAGQGLVNIDLPDDLPSHENIANHKQMGDIIQAKARRETELGIPRTELLELSIPDGTPQRSRRREATPLFELRYKLIPFNITGIVGRVTQSGFLNMVGAAYHDVLDHLVREQPAGQWAPVAWRLDIDTVRKAVKRKKNATEKVYWDKFQQDENAPGGAKPSPAEYVTEQQPQRRMVLAIAFAEIAQIDPTCPLKRSDPRQEGGTFFKYEKERKLKYLPKALAAERVEAEALITAFYEQPELPAAPPTPEINLEMARTLIAGGWSPQKAAESLGISRQKLQAALKKDDARIAAAKTGDEEP